MTKGSFPKKSMVKYEFFPKASPPLTFGIFEALFSLFPKLLNKNFKKKMLTVFNLLAHWHFFAFDCFRGRPGPPPPFLEEYHKKAIKKIEGFPNHTNINININEIIYK